MAAGAGSSEAVDVARHGAMAGVSAGVRAPATLGSFLRSFTFGNVAQLGKVNRELLAELARRAPLLPGAETLAFVDIDSTQRRGDGPKKQGAPVRHTQNSPQTVLGPGLDAPAATVRT